MMLEHMNEISSTVEFIIQRYSRVNIYKNDTHHIWSGEYYEKLLRYIEKVVYKPSSTGKQVVLYKPKSEHHRNEHHRTDHHRIEQHRNPYADLASSVLNGFAKILNLKN